LLFIAVMALTGCAASQDKLALDDLEHGTSISSKMAKGRVSVQIGMICSGGIFGWMGIIGGHLNA
jgi:hypothetical protein